MCISNDTKTSYYVTFCIVYKPVPVVPELLVKISVEFPILVVFALELLLSGNASVIETKDSFSLVYTDTRSKLGADTLDAVIRFPDNVIVLSDWVVLLNEFRSESESCC